MARVLIGVSGLQHPGWDENYYPPDIPEDWKLAYYANDFTAIVLPESAWRSAQSDELTEWLEDIDEAFRVYLRVTTQMPDKAEVDTAKALFKPYFAGFLVDDAVEVRPKQLLSGTSWLLPDRCKYENARHWQPLEKIDKPVNAVILDKDMNKRELKQAFEKGSSYIDEENDVLVLYDVPEPDAQELKELRILLELMGIA